MLHVDTNPVLALHLVAEIHELEVFLKTPAGSNKIEPPFLKLTGAATGLHLALISLVQLGQAVCYACLLAQPRCCLGWQHAANMQTGLFH